MATLKTKTAAYSRVQWTLAGVIVCGVALFYLMGYRPAKARLASLEMQINAKQRDLSQSRDKAKNLPILALEVQQLESRVATYDRQFPRQPELGPFIRDLTRISRQSALGEWKYQPGAPRRADAFQEVPIVMQFQGDFLGAVSFLREIEELPRLTRVKKLRVKNRDSKTGAVDVEATLSIFFSEG